MAGASRARRSGTQGSVAFTRSSRPAPKQGWVRFSALRGGSAGAARGRSAGAAGGAKSFLTETVPRVCSAGAARQLAVRADSAFYRRAVLGTAVRLGVEFSATARQDNKIRAAIDAIPEDAWTPIRYWVPSLEVSGADVAETQLPGVLRQGRHQRASGRPPSSSNASPC
jgi:hypothetical protein